MMDLTLAEIEAELAHHDPSCLQCDLLMVSRGQWENADEAERQELVEEGYVKGGSRGLCRPCYEATPAADLPPKRLHSTRSDVLVFNARAIALAHNRDQLMARGWLQEEACDWLGVDSSWLRRAHARAAA